MLRIDVPRGQRPLIKVIVGRSAAQSVLGGLSAPQRTPSTTADFLIDTGASHSVIDLGLAKKLALQPMSQMPVKTASSGSGHVMSTLFMASLSIAFTDTLYSSPMVPLGSQDFGNHGFHGLLGMDILSHFIMTFNGPANFIELRWPAAPSKKRKR
ncbi:hypothetical protein GC173_11480 [bacterium]|nr:hypothetical protein [bacterium]